MTVNGTVACVFLTTAISWPSPPARAQQADEATSDAAVKEKEKASAERLLELRRRAEGTRVFIVGDDGHQEVEMLSEPVFRYDDQPRDIIDGTLWVWGGPGRPAALEKVEYYPPAPLHWTYCLASLSSGLVAAEWRGGRRWTATKPGAELRPCDDAPKPAATKAARIRQMKDLARRFTVRSSEGTERSEQLRLMPRAIHRYADPEHGQEDGAIFGFGSGTNPACLLLVELRSNDESPRSWHYGFVGMSAESLRAHLDDHEVWFFPAAGKVGAIDSWIWFFETPGMED
ncbi:MAG TPA: hypothetical protein VMV69_14110 [Pirellulales bacterium]|nr:hypothetical protein [Pirellulales bacterium]